ncbi:MAG: phosphopantothenoylcysteine decarboxylase [Candidatus Omnitrophota bacterium]
MSFKNKRVLITAGPTWVAIDRVRVISNTATGETGMLLAQSLQRLGAKVHLVLGPVEIAFFQKKISVLRFRFFDELECLVKDELKKRHFDYVFHAAAVSDYRPKEFYEQKVKSGLSRWQLALVPTDKIINSIKRWDRKVFLVGFKFLPQGPKMRLIQQARSLMRDSGCDCVVANLGPYPYRAWIVSRTGVSRGNHSRRELIDNLIKGIP